MKFEMNYKNQTILVDDVNVIESSGVLFGTIVAVQDEDSCVFIRTGPRKIIISGSYALEECNAKIYDSVESYEEALMEEFEL